MNAKRLRTRIERLERRINGHECEACTRTAFEQVAARGDPNLVAPARCPDCGNPNPRIPMREVDALVADEQRLKELERMLSERWSKEHPPKGDGSES